MLDVWLAKGKVHLMHGSPKYDKLLRLLVFTEGMELWDPVAQKGWLTILLPLTNRTFFIYNFNQIIDKDIKK